MEPTEFVMVMPIITAIELASQFLMAMLAMLVPKSMQLATPTLVVEPMAIIIMVALAFAMHFHLHRK